MSEHKILNEVETKELVSNTFDELLKLKVGDQKNDRLSLMSYGGIDALWKVATSFARSTIVPKDYQNKPDNCLVAIEMAENVGVSALSVMQNLYIVHGKPAWSAQYIVSRINSCGRYSQLKYKVDQTDRKIKVGNKTFNDIEFTAYTTELATGETLESPVVTLQMAVDEGWYGKTGSKWQTMPDIMGRYRSASFFGKLYCPDVMNGIQSAEEVIDSSLDDDENQSKQTIDQKANKKTLSQSEEESEANPAQEQEQGSYDEPSTTEGQQEDAGF